MACVGNTGSKVHFMDLNRLTLVYQCKYLDRMKDSCNFFLLFLNNLSLGVLLSCLLVSEFYNTFISLSIICVFLAYNFGTQSFNFENNFDSILC